MCHQWQLKQIIWIVGHIIIIQKFVQDHHISTGHVRIECDGLSALQQAQSTCPVNPAAPHYDLIRAIQQIKRSIPVKFLFEHVQGHQDTGTPTVLPQMTWMNIKMDSLAKATIDRNAIGPQQYHLEDEPWVHSIQGQQQVRNVSMAIQTHINT